MNYILNCSDVIEVNGEIDHLGLMAFKVLLNNPKLALSNDSQGNGESIALNYVNKLPKNNRLIELANSVLNAILALDSNSEEITTGSILEFLREHPDATLIVKMVSEYSPKADVNYLNYLLEAIMEIQELPIYAKAGAINLIDEMSDAELKELVDK